MIKLAALEETEYTDPVTGLAIRVSTTTRITYRNLYKNKKDENFLRMRNFQLNEIIAKDFIQSRRKVVHRFKLKDEGIGEIRNKVRSSWYYISAIRGNSIDILVLQNAWKAPRYKVKPQENE